MRVALPYSTGFGRLDMSGNDAIKHSRRRFIRIAGTATTGLARAWGLITARRCSEDR